MIEYTTIYCIAPGPVCLAWARWKRNILFLAALPSLCWMSDQDQYQNQDQDHDFDQQESSRLSFQGNFHVLKK